MEKDKEHEKEKNNASVANSEHTARLRTIDVDEPKKKKIFDKGRLSKYARKAGKSVKKDNAVKADSTVKTDKAVKSSKMSPTYRKKYIILAVVVLVCFIGAYQFVKVKDVNFTVLPENISNKIDSEDLERGDALTLRKLYNINNGEYDEFVLFAPKSNMVADEILVIKCKPKQIDSVMAKIQKRIDDQSNSFKNYAPAQYGIISSSELKKKGDYIFFVSAKNIGAINKAIDNSYK